MIYRVDGVLKRHYVPDMGCYKCTVDDGRKYFETLDEACKYTDKIFETTGVMLAVRTLGTAM